MKQTAIVIPIADSPSFLKRTAETLIALNEYDFILIDDGTSSQEFDQLEEYKHINYIEYENCSGQGAAVLHGYEFARDMQYQYCIILDPILKEFEKDINDLITNLKYGYDIVTASRILENYNHDSFSQERVTIITTISDKLTSIIENDITDPLSGIKGFRIGALENMELTEFSPAFFLQLFIQAYYFGQSIIEIPAYDGSSFGRELNQFEDPLGEMLSIMETERYLYAKGNIN